MISPSTTTTASQIQHLDQVCVIHADFDIWSGQTRLDPKDLKLGVGGEIPPEKLALLGSKKICDPARLKGFSRLKTKARRVLAHYGLPFMSGWAVPAERLDTIMKQLDQIKDEFEEVRQTFLTQYDTAVEAWIADNPGYEDIIRAGAMPRSVVEKRIGFDYAVYHIRPAGAASEQQLGRQVESLGNDLFSEIVKEANTFYEEKLRGASELLTSTRPTLQKLYDKVDGLSFLNAAFDPLARLLNETIKGYATYASGGRILAPYLYQVVAAVLICCDRQKIEGYANGTVQVQDMTPDPSSLAADQAPAPSAADVAPATTATEPTPEPSVPDVAGADAQPQSPDQPAQGSSPVEAPQQAESPSSHRASDEKEVASEAPAQEAEPTMPVTDAEPPLDASPEALQASMDRFFADFETDQSPASHAEEEAVESSAVALPTPAPAPVQPTAPAMPMQAAPAPEPVPVPELDDDDDWAW